MKLSFFALCGITSALVACQSVPVDSSKTIKRYQPITENIITSSALINESYVLPEKFDHDFDVSAHETLVDVDFSKSKSLAPFTSAPISELSYWNEGFVEPIIDERGIQLLPNNFAVNPEKSRMLWASGIQLYLDNSEYQGYVIQVKGDVINDGACEADPSIFFNEMNADYTLLEKKCQEGKFDNTYYALAKGDISRLMILSTTRHVRNTETARSVIIEAVKIEGLKFIQHPIEGKLNIKLASMSPSCFFTTAEGSLFSEFTAGKAGYLGKVSGNLSAGDGKVIRIKGDITKDLDIEFKLIEVGGVNQRRYIYPLTMIEGSYETMKDRWGCSYMMEVKTDGYYSNLRFEE
jgi:hypothetical protein